MTIKDIAKEAGVSAMTVSNVINGRFSHVSQKTIDKVNHIIAENNYTPNMTARTLASNRSNIIFLIIPLSAEQQNMFYSPYISTLSAILEYQLRLKGYHGMIRSVHDITELTTLFKMWPADGAILLLPDFDQYFEELKSTITSPIVMMDSCMGDRGIPNIRCNDFKGTYLATRHLLDYGHKRIAFMADYKNSMVLSDRYEGYVKALSEAGFKPDPELIFEESPDYEHGLRLGTQLAGMKNPPTAIVTTSDYAAVGIMEGARQGGMKLPEQLSVTGFDNLNFSIFCSPKLTSVSQNIEQKSKLAIEKLLHNIENPKEAAECSEEFIDVELVVRESTHRLS